MSTKQHILFYSNYCLYSKELLVTVTKLNLKSRFLMVCVDRHRSSIPPSVDRVPAIMTPDRKLVFDEEITTYIHTLVDKDRSSSATTKSNHPQRAVVGVTGDPREICSATSTTSTGFSYLGEGDGGGGGDNLTGSLEQEDFSISSSFGIFGQDQHIETPNEDDNEEDSSLDYERFKASRDADIVIPTTGK
jgi:hypothetical protein